MKKSRVVAATFGVGVLLLTACGENEESNYPTESVDLTIPFGPGGATDLAARAVADGLSNELGQPVNPTNREGANQITAVTHVNQAQPDGYSLLADGAGSSTLQSLLGDLPYEWDDRTFIAQVAEGSHVYAVGAGSGVETLDGVIESIQEDPSSFSVAWLGGTSSSDFATLQLLEEAGVDPNKVNFVPFTSSGDAMQAAAAEDVDLAAAGSSAMASLYSSGDLAPLALTGEDPNFPEVPLTTDEGYPGLDMTYWVGISGPADLPENVVDVLANTLTDLEGDEEMVESFETLGMTVDIVTGDELAENVENEAATFAELDSLVAE